MKIEDRLKRWVGIEHVEDVILLYRYGARNIDELYTMVMLGRTCEPSDRLHFNTWKITLVNKLVLMIALYKRHGLRYKSKIKEENAKLQYQSETKTRLYAITK